ncbi:PAS domain S-box-containing protein/diguanylate cyclase (GGDEF) domain-containing protein [Janthinobacterium sp. TND4EL3]|uniref:EAL domain-containing protein n=1 Tax=Janthinobacterium sp. TND4EL3 TaxID=1907311 RepID=UPI000957492C|nr:EAL domain-containing protein [Janthinobacterium sp. TND4EL3]SIP90386.1 PAS domain S-box-containing protein/diguanylate cyclase (GGDEF) domain-containing protein [Janthinobacterium sp. TND4EL3]
MSDLQKRLQMALDAAHMAIWDSRLVNGQVIDGTVSWSARGAALLGLEERALTQPFRSFLDCVHADDRDKVINVLQDGVRRRDGYALQYRVVWPDDSEHWLAAKAQVFMDGGGQPERTLGIIWDVTEHMAREIMIAERKELAEVTLSSIGDGVMTTDPQGKTRYLNRVAEQLTGWSNDMAQGQDIQDTLSLLDEHTGQAPEHVAIKCLRLRQAIGMSTHTLLLTREGRRIAIEESAAPIWSRDGDILGAVVVFRDVSHERKLSQELSWQATHDMLTGLLNRREFEHLVAGALHTAKQDGHVHALLYLDLDQFKVINDTCGHGAGDVLLQLLAKMLQGRMRDSDILARLGGDELGVLLPHCPLDHARQIGEQLRQAVREFRFAWDERSFELGVSIGIVEISQDSKSMSELLSAADQACYLAKEQGRNRLHVYQEADVMLAQRHGEMLWISRLNEAFTHDYFRLYAMPIVHLRDRPEYHDEVLIRIRNGKGDLILPGTFIPAAERYDMMLSIDRWVIRAVCQHIQSVRDSLPPLEAMAESRRRAPALYSVNLSGMSLADTGLHDYITGQFVQYAVAPEQICFEITETAVIANLPQAQVFMHKLKALGCRFSLDDFGSGFSSFGYLRALPVDYLKIDGVFVRDIASNAVNRAMVKAINEVGHVMGLKTVAEYVENDATLAIIRELGIDYAQGYAVGGLRPLTAGVD